MAFIRRVPWYWIGIATIVGSVSLLTSGVLENALRSYSDTISWSLPLSSLFASVAVEIILYFFLAGILQLALFAVCAVVLSPLTLTRGARGFAVMLGRLLEFNVALLLVGGLGNVIWVAVARNKLYVARDPVVEYFSFIPYSSSIYDYDWGSFHGHLLPGASDFQLGALWGSISLLVWASTVAWLRTLHAKAAV